MKVLLLSLIGLFVALQGLQADVRIATYNIKFLNANAPTQRVDNLREVISELSADVIGLQEIGDREALHQIFDPAEWIVLIDDDSGDDQDVALVIKRSSGIKPVGVAEDLDLEDGDFLFPEHEHRSEFPRRRDGLCVKLQVTGYSEPIFVVVQHTKARSGGRLKTTPRRANNARKLVAALEVRFDEKNVIVVGDFNDSPDDQSLNILENGDPRAQFEAENRSGRFLVNLTEPLWALGKCSWSHRQFPIDSDSGRIDLVDTNARSANASERNSNSRSFYEKNLLDNVLISRSMLDEYVEGSASIFDGPPATRHPSVSGGYKLQASDHLPVFADFRFVSRTDVSVKITAVLPNPIGDDTGKETVTLRNLSGERVSLEGWTLRDRAGKVVELGGEVPARNSRKLVLPGRKMPLNQTGDSVFLHDDGGNLVHSVTYQEAQVEVGLEIAFN